MEKPLINRINEALFFIKIDQVFGGVFHRDIKICHIDQQIIPTAVAPCQHINDIFDLTSDDVASGKIRALEDISHEALGHEMLHQHVDDGIEGNIRIKRLAANGMEFIERGFKCIVIVGFFVDQRFKFACQLGDSFTKARNSSIELFHIRRLVAVKTLQQVREAVAVCA